MRIISTILIGILCASCLEGTDNSPPDLFDAGAEKIQVEVSWDDTLWVCHHPGTKFHNQPCVEEKYPIGCYVDGDQHKFCWLLSREECTNESSEQNTIQACELFSTF